MSFYFSANTIIYFLMRHEVDATELDDVYLEQADDEFAETAPTMTVTSTTTTVTTTAPIETARPSSRRSVADATERQRRQQRRQQRWKRGRRDFDRTLAPRGQSAGGVSAES